MALCAVHLEGEAGKVEPYRRVLICACESSPSCDWGCQWTEGEKWALLAFFRGFSKGRWIVLLLVATEVSGSCPSLYLGCFRMLEAEWVGNTIISLSTSILQHSFLFSLWNVCAEVFKLIVILKACIKLMWLIESAWLLSSNKIFRAPMHVDDDGEAGNPGSENCLWRETEACKCLKASSSGSRCQGA